MSEIDWSEAPEGAMRHNEKLGCSWLRKVNERIDYYINDTWVPYSVEQEGKKHWRDATSRPKQTPYDVDAHVSDATTAKLERDDRRDWVLNGSEWNEGGLILSGWTFEQLLTCGKPVERFHAPTPSTDVDTTITQRGERYGLFADGAVIMQDLKNVMRATQGWERLTPSQREALEMIQHKIGRILNGDPMYDDNYRDICGYSQLILDELNGVAR